MSTTALQPRDRVDRVIMIWAQHLLGIGHLMRAATLARAFAAAGWQAHLVSGGPPVALLRAGSTDRIGEAAGKGAMTAHQLPPVASEDPTFVRLVDGDGAPADDALWRARRTMLLDLFRNVAPAALLVEHYPFGRRAFRRELTPLLEAAAAAGCRRICSVRDILVTRSPERHREAREVVRRDFDHVLVHGDPTVVAFDATYPHAADLGDRLAYSGYLGGAAVPAVPRGDEIVVSAGGGRVGQVIEQAAMAAADLDGANRPWRLLVGGGRPAEELAALREAAPSRMTVERARPDFRELLAAAGASVSQAGYNTAMDVLTTAVPAVMVPFAAPGETEQTLRAERLAALGRCVHLPEAALTGEALLTAIARAQALTPAPAPIRLDGAAETVRLVGNWVAE